MTLANEQTTTRLSQLIEQARRYLTLQKDYLSLHGVEVLTRLFTAIALTAIILLISFLVVLFGSFALAYWLGALLDSAILGFAIIAGVLFLFALLVYANRTAWIILPITRFLVGIFAQQVTVATQEGITTEKAALQQQITHAQDDMRDNATRILSPQPEARNGWETAANLFQNGMTIYRGIQIGMSAVAAIRSVFNLGSKRRRRR